MACLIDYSLIILYSIAIGVCFGEYNDKGEAIVNGWPAFSIFIFWFIMTVGIEQLWGATLGNQTQNLKPVPKYYPRKKLTLGQSIKRHLISPLDCQLMGLVAILALTKTENNQRLGDLWADTLVVDLSDEEQGEKK